MVEVTGSSPVLPTSPKKPRTPSAGFFVGCRDKIAWSVSEVELTAVVGIDAGADFASDFGLTLSRPSHENASNHGVRCGDPSNVVKLRGAHRDFEDAKVGEQEAIHPQALGA